MDCRGVQTTTSALHWVTWLFSFGLRTQHPLLKKSGACSISQRPDTRPKPQHHLCLLKPTFQVACTVKSLMKQSEIPWAKIPCSLLLCFSSEQGAAQTWDHQIILVEKYNCCSQLNTDITSQFPSLNDQPEMLTLRIVRNAIEILMARRNLQSEDSKDRKKYIFFIFPPHSWLYCHCISKGVVVNGGKESEKD